MESRKQHMVKLQTKINNLEEIDQCDVAIELYFAGYKPNFSTSIADQVTAGYGLLDSNGFWQYQLPEGYEEIFQK